MSPPSSAPSHAPLTVFLVDDDRLLLDMYSLKFKAAGSVVESFPDPSTALDKLRQGAHPDIILLDIVMPMLTGFEFLETMRKEKLAEQTKVVMLSNQGAQEDIDKATALGAAGYIIKASSIPSEVLEKALAIAAGTA